MIEFEVTLRDTQTEVTQTYAMDEIQAARTNDRNMVEKVVEWVVSDVVEEWRVPGSIKQ